MLSIKIKTQFEKIHHWPEAPKDVEFLRNLHRHDFYVIVQIEVKDNDRELEYFLTKKQIDSIIKEQIIPLEDRSSCEDFAEKILDYLEVIYPNRFIEVEVNEDNQNGSVINNK